MIYNNAAHRHVHSTALNLYTGQLPAGLLPTVTSIPITYSMQNISHAIKNSNNA